MSPGRTTSATDLKPTPTHKHLPYLDGWRGMAILALLAGHFMSLPLINAGRLGVEIFFVLSGRLMAQNLFHDKIPLPLFFKRRFSKIYPTIFIFTLALLLVATTTGLFQFTTLQLIGLLTFTYNYIAVYTRDFAVSPIGHIWSLCIEEHAYILLAVIAAFARRGKVDPKLVVGALALAAIANGWIQTLIQGRPYYEVYWRTDVRISSIFLATFFQLLASERNWRFTGLAGFLPILVIIAGVMLNIRMSPDWLKYSLGTACLAFGVATIDRGHVLHTRLLSIPALGFIGILSYSLYVWQQPFHAMIPLIGSSLAFLLAIAVGTGMFYLWENPIRLRLNRLWRRTE